MARPKSAQDKSGGSTPQLPAQPQRRSSQRLSNRLGKPESGDLKALPRNLPKIEVIIPSGKDPIMPKSRSSLATSADDDSTHAHYETPASSLAVTPMDIGSDQSDAELARILQAKEYESKEPLAHRFTTLKRKKTQIKNEIMDSEDETNWIHSMLPSDEDKPLTKRQRAQKEAAAKRPNFWSPSSDNVFPKPKPTPKWTEIDPPISQRPRGGRAARLKEELSEPDSAGDDKPFAKRQGEEQPSTGKSGKVVLNESDNPFPQAKSTRNWTEIDPHQSQRPRKGGAALSDNGVPDSDISQLDELDTSSSLSDYLASDLEDWDSLFTDFDSDENSIGYRPGATAVPAPAVTLPVAPQVPVTLPAAPQVLVTRARRRRPLYRDRSRDPSGDSLDGMTRRMQSERLKLERAHPEIMTMWKDLATIKPIKPVPAQQPAGISRQLKSFQLEGLNWMIRQEKSTYQGGLLGDEMGMGKTIQAVSLIMSDFPAKQPTLVVVPPVALMQWQSEIDAYTNGKLKVIVYHGTNAKAKKMAQKELESYNVIMVSYSGLESLYRKESKGWNRLDGIVKEDSMLHAIKYHRIILDEAHSIKQRNTSVARACFALKSTYKWCLSGTPVQNRIGEFFSLLRFLNVKPFACYFCKACDCKEIHWSQDEHKRCTFCKHSGIQHVSVFNQELLNPISMSGDPEQRRAGMAKLRLITERIMLRRLKKDYTAAMELPAKAIVLHREFFGEIEQDFSKSIMEGSARKFDTYVSRGVMLNNYANIFGLIMQMRQVANHPDLILKKHGEGGQNILVCSVCDEPAEEAIRSRCRHEFCRQCAKNYVRSFGGVDADCPRCHIPLSIDFDQPDIEQEEETMKKSSIINRIKMEDWTSSTKIEMLIYDLYKLRSNKTTHKSIVFSQFTSMLQLIEWRLRRAGFSTVMLDGSMSPQQRQRSIDYFMNNVHVEVFLVSLKAGGVALNLTEASRVFIVDPWWNPAAEAQSADRCHRIGQTRPCVITRLCIEDSVESRMVLLQEKKANMIDATINNDDMAMDRLTPADMQFLFRGS